MTDPYGFAAHRPSEEHILPGAYRPWLLSEKLPGPARTIDPPSAVNYCLECGKKKCNNCMGDAKRRPRPESEVG